HPHISGKALDELRFHRFYRKLSSSVHISRLQTFGPKQSLDSMPAHQPEPVPENRRIHNSTRSEAVRRYHQPMPAGFGFPRNRKRSLSLPAIFRSSSQHVLLLALSAHRHEQP